MWAKTTRPGEGLLDGSLLRGFFKDSKRDMAHTHSGVSLAEQWRAVEDRRPPSR